MGLDISDMYPVGPRLFYRSLDDQLDSQYKTYMQQHISMA